MDSMRSLPIVAALLAGLLGLCGPAAAEPPVKAWEADGFVWPESVAFDSKRGLLYVSSMGGPPLEKTGAGFITKLSLDGQVLERAWVAGLNAPKGMAIHEGRLYVSAVDQLVVVDIETGDVVARHDAPGIAFMNDVAADAEGRIYVSDMGGDAIWMLAGDGFRVWLADANLTSPNGLKAEAERLVFGSAGPFIEGTKTRTPTPLKTVAYDDKAVGVIGNGAPVGHIDGVEPDGNGNYLATEFRSGTLFRVHPSGRSERLLVLSPGSADLGYVPSRELAVIPMMKDGKVVAYRIQ
jgi:sugar lactone lactonase YvrE